ncbi:hypothetical protein AAGW05_15240 [Arthrobacter sp. LAPM80]|uniref:hypothetical protein n=1 Tax=Arthrobacter sp. LAPM80 TaxID=3141788 RepID=UPI00398AB23D
MLPITKETAVLGMDHVLEGHLPDLKTRTLALVHYVFQSQFNSDHTPAFASYLMAMAPLLLVYMFAQRWVISGVMRGSTQ